MALNLSKYRNELLDAWKDVVDEKTPNDWALFGYEKQTNDLKVISMGDGGLDELANEFNSSKIMYAFCRVSDPNTELSKFVFINWRNLPTAVFLPQPQQIPSVPGSSTFPQGEGAPLPKKGICANHVADISNFFKGAHVTVNARTEDDIDSASILEKVGKASASKFNFKERSDPTQNIAPVGSVYKRIQPTREINSTAREKFWEKEQAEEKQRVIVERKKAEEEKKRLEVERKEREMRESAARDIIVKERSHSISQIKEASRNADNVSRTQEYEKMQWEKQLQDDAQEERERRTRSESLRRERSHEAQNLISKRTINARAIFEQNTCAGQLSSIHTNPQPKVLQEFEAASRNETLASTPKEEPPYVPSAANKESHETLQNSDKTRTNEFTKTVLRDSETGQSIEDEQDWEEPPLKDSPKTEDTLLELLAEQQNKISPTPETNEVINTSQQGADLWARALYDYQAADETEISFDPDDVITQIEQIDEGWWQGRAPDGSYGLFPANYVELLVD